MYPGAGPPSHEEFGHPGCGDRSPRTPPRASHSPGYTMPIQFTDGPPKTKSEFAAALPELVVEAHRNGVSVLGGWSASTAMPPASRP